LPQQGRDLSGIVINYELYISADNRNWGSPVIAGEFSNIRNSPVLQQLSFTTTTGRYLKFKALTTVNDQPRIGMAELDVVTP
jgi:alpha-L-fucosidase